MQNVACDCMHQFKKYYREPVLTSSKHTDYDFTDSCGIKVGLFVGSFDNSHSLHLIGRRSRTSETKGLCSDAFVDLDEMSVVRR